MEEAFLGLPPFINGTYSSNCDFQTAKNLYSVAAPVIIVLTLISNIFYVYLVNCDEDDRSGNTVQNTGIAISNTLHGSLQMVIFIQFFGVNNLDEPMSYHWCNSYRIIGYVLPNICHTASMWQISLYGIQRFLCFRWPFSAFVWFKVDRFLKYTVIIYICAFLVHGYKLFDFAYETARPCDFNYRSGIQDGIYLTFYEWFCIMFVQLIPCITMTISVFLLIYAIRLSYLRRKRVFVNSQTAIPRNRKYIMQQCQVIGILLLNLCVEWPITIITLWHKQSPNVTSKCFYTSAVTLHFALFFSYFLYFPIYIILNFELRNTLVKVVTDMKAFCRRHFIIEEVESNTVLNDQIFNNFYKIF